MTEEQIIEIIKLEAHKNLTIVDEGTDSYNDYVIRGVDLMAKSLVKLFAIPAVVGRSEQLKAFADYAQKRVWEDGDKDLSEFVDEFLRL